MLCVTINMYDEHVESVAQLAEFVKLSKCAEFSSKDRRETYEWMGKTLGKFRYRRLSKKEKGIVRAYLQTVTGYSDTQLDRLIRRKQETGRVYAKKRTQPTFPRVYTTDDVALLSEVDNAEGRRTGAAVKKTCSDMYTVYRDKRFERLSKISVSHLYNLRGTRVYESRSLTYTQTRSIATPIGERRTPIHGGKPGYLRVDSVHQGDLDKQKGVYHINMVDEVTQDEVVVCVEGIAEEFLRPALEEALDVFPFVVVNFHSDNGSEYVNYTVARLLNKLMIGQTKSRARHTNDNALVEGKNGAVIRKHVGYRYIHKKHARLINEWYREYFNPYLFFHRQCAFATDLIDVKGKIKKVYKTYLTPCEKLLSIEKVEQYLKPGSTKESLQAAMMKKTHLAAAQEMQEKKDQLFAKISALVVH